MVASVFPKNQEEYFEQLRRAPLLALPTALLFVASMGGIGLVWYLAMTGQIPIWYGTIANGLITYLLFSVIHDAAHMSLSRVKWLNETIGAIGLFFLFPYAPMVLLRWVHNKHHSYANGPLDPDLYEHESPWWQVPFRWTMFDGAYIYYFIKHGQNVRKKHGRELVAFLRSFVRVVRGSDLLRIRIRTLYAVVSSLADHAVPDCRRFSSSCPTIRQWSPKMKSPIWRRRCATDGNGC